MDKPRQPYPSITLASPSRLVAMHLAPEEIELLEAFRSMDAIRQDHINFAACSLAQAFPRERGAPALRVVPSAGRGNAGTHVNRIDERSAAHTTEAGQG
jgi:hypothetical protein